MAYTTIDNPELYFQVSLYTGNGSIRSITLDGSEDMQPDFVWIKNRGGTYASPAFDAVRGATKFLETQDSNAEATDSATLTGFNSDGFALGADGSSYVNRSSSPNTYVAWSWKAGTTSGLSGGDITPSAYSINTTSKIGIYAYTGNGGSSQTITHGLGATPTCVIFKERGGAEQWRVQHMSAANPFTKMLLLNDNDAEGSQSNGLSAVSSTTITFGSDGAYNLNTDTYVCYIFCDVAGYSKMGKYVGTGDADTGAFIYTGFKPAWVMTKKFSGTGNWIIGDSTTNPGNPIGLQLEANGTGAEYERDRFDLLSNGFKNRNAGGDANGDGESYIYLAFAEAPLVNSEGVPCNAR